MIWYGSWWFVFCMVVWCMVCGFSRNEYDGDDDDDDDDHHHHNHHHHHHGHDHIQYRDHNAADRHVENSTSIEMLILPRRSWFLNTICYEVRILQSRTTIRLIQSQGHKYFKINIYYKTIIIYIYTSNPNGNQKINYRLQLGDISRCVKG